MLRRRCDNISATAAGCHLHARCGMGREPKSGVRFLPAVERASDLDVSVGGIPVAAQCPDPDDVRHGEITDSHWVVPGRVSR